MTNILFKKLEPLPQPKVQLERLINSTFTFSNTGKVAVKKFDQSPENINEESNIIPELDDDENSFTETITKDEGFINVLNNFKIQMGKKEKKKIEFIDHESEPNALFRVRVEMGETKTKDFIVKALRTEKKAEFVYHNEIIQNRNKKIDDIVCRVGRNDEIILKDNIQKIDGEYLF